MAKRYKRKPHDTEIGYVIRDMEKLLDVLDNLGNRLYELLYTDGEEDPAFRLKAILKDLKKGYLLDDILHILFRRDEDGFSGPKQEGVRFIRFKEPGP